MGIVLPGRRTAAGDQCGPHQAATKKFANHSTVYNPCGAAPVPWQSSAGGRIKLEWDPFWREKSTRICVPEEL